MMSASPLSGAAATVTAIERSADMAAMRHAVRAFSRPPGYDRFVLYTAPKSGDGVVEELLWMEGGWFGDGSREKKRIVLLRTLIRWIASGRRRLDVALRLGLSERTMENHLRPIRKRLERVRKSARHHTLRRMSSFNTRR